MFCTSRQPSPGLASSMSAITPEVTGAEAEVPPKISVKSPGTSPAGPVTSVETEAAGAVKRMFVPKFVKSLVSPALSVAATLIV